MNTAAFDRFLDDIAGQRTFEKIPDLPRVTTTVAKLNKSLWPDLEKQVSELGERYE